MILTARGAAAPEIPLAELQKKLEQEINDQDSHRHLKLVDVDPFLNSWICN